MKKNIKRKARGRLGAAPGSGTSPKGKPVSVFRGDTWLAYAPGQDIRFKDAWVLRSERGALHACVSSREHLMQIAKHCEAKVKWPNNVLGVTKADSGNANEMDKGT